MFRYSWNVPYFWQEAIPNGVYYVKNRADSNYIDTTGQSTNGSYVEQRPYSGRTVQQFDVTYADGWYTVTNMSDGQCLDTGGNAANGTNLEQWPDNESVSNQHWKFQATDSGYYQMINQSSGISIDTGGLTAAGSDLQLWYPSSSYNQQWTFVAK
jgi:hypothetical protein